MKNNLFWALFGISVLLGGVAVSVVIFMLVDQDWDIYRYLNQSFAEYLLLSLPYFWLILVAIFFAFAWLDLRNTKSGYKYGFLKIAAINIFASFIVGVVLFYSGFGLKLENVFANNIPFYQAMHPLRPAKIWENPEKGFLVGQISGLSGDSDFILRDPKSQEWIVLCEHCLWRGIARDEIGTVVKVLGKQIDQAVFEGVEVRIGRPELGPKCIGESGCMMAKPGKGKK